MNSSYSISPLPSRSNCVMTLSISRSLASFPISLKTFLSSSRSISPELSTSNLLNISLGSRSPFIHLISSSSPSLGVVVSIFRTRLMTSLLLDPSSVYQSSTKLSETCVCVESGWIMAQPSLSAMKRSSSMSTALSYAWLKSKDGCSCCFTPSSCSLCLEGSLIFLAWVSLSLRVGSTVMMRFSTDGVKTSFFSRISSRAAMASFEYSPLGPSGSNQHLSSEFLKLQLSMTRSNLSPRSMGRLMRLLPPISPRGLPLRSIFFRHKFCLSATAMQNPAWGVMPLFRRSRFKSFVFSIRDCPTAIPPSAPKAL
mmetsp:Transcript_21568/g.44980  ORF Transcript_21568/g.44980 Transcript_21568/m.44980 type:complete len:311 (-) Transcript_21568:429-1361(-)